MTALVTDHLALSLTIAFVGALGGLSLTLFEQRRTARGGHPDLPNPLGLMVTGLMAWTAFALVWLLALMMGLLAVAVITALAAFAIHRTGGLGADLTRYTALRLPMALGALLFSLALWLGTFALVE